MLTNRYRIRSNGFRYRVQRMSLDVRHTQESLRELLRGCGKWGRTIARIFLPPFLWIENKAICKWLDGFLLASESVQNLKPSKPVMWCEIIWCEGYPHSVPIGGGHYELYETSSAQEAYNWIKQQDPEAEVLTSEWKPLN